MHKPMNRKRNGTALGDVEEVAMTGGRHNEVLNYIMCIDTDITSRRSNVTYALALLTTKTPSRIVTNTAVTLGSVETVRFSS